MTNEIMATIIGCGLIFLTLIVSYIFIARDILKEKKFTEEDRDFWRKRYTELNNNCLANDLYDIDHEDSYITMKLKNLKEKKGKTNE